MASVETAYWSPMCLFYNIFILSTLSNIFPIQENPSCSFLCLIALPCQIGNKSFITCTQGETSASCLLWISAFYLFTITRPITFPVYGIINLFLMYRIQVASDSTTVLADSDICTFWSPYYSGAQ